MRGLVRSQSSNVLTIIRFFSDFLLRYDLMYTSLKLQKLSLFYKYTIVTTPISIRSLESDDDY